MKRNAMEGSLHIIAKALSDDCGVQVVIGGNQACTDGKIVRVPALPANHDAAKVLAFGYIRHEPGHILWTNMGLWQTLKDDDLHRHVSNILEDIRIEGNMMRRYPGARISLSQLVNHLVADGSFPIPTGEWSEAKLMQAYMLYRLRRDVLEQIAIGQLADSAETLLREKLPGGVVTRLSALMYEVVHCDSTKQVIALAKRIITMMQEEADKKDQESQGGSGQAGSRNQAAGNRQSGQQDQATSATDGEGQGGGGEDAAGEDPANKQANGADNDGAGNGDEKAGGASGCAESPNQSDTGGSNQTQTPAADESDGGGQGKGAGSAKAQADAIRRALAPGAGDGYKDVGDVLREQLEALSAEAPYRLGEPKAKRVHARGGNGPALVSKVRRETNALRRRMQHMLQSIATSKPFAADTGPRIEPSRLYRVKLGDPKVYRKLVDGIKVNTAVQVLIDRSGSMSDQIDFTLETAAAVALAMDHLPGVDCSVAIFPAAYPYSAEILTDFGEGIRRTISAYPLVSATGGTPMAEALLWGGLNLWKVNKPRKIVLVVTDGGPDNPRAVEDVRDDLQRMGIECMGLGIQCQTDHLFAASATVHNIEELPKGVFGMMREALFQRKFA